METVELYKKYKWCEADNKVLDSRPEIETFLRKVKESLDKPEAIDLDRQRLLFKIALWAIDGATATRVLTDGKDLPPAVADVVLTAKLPRQQFE